MRRCTKCGAELPAQAPGPGRPRSKCDRCAGRKPAEAVVKALPTRETTEVGEGLAAGISAVLEDCGRHGTAAGMAAIHAATVLDQGGHTAAGAASLLKEMRAAVEEATKNASTGDDIVDELRAKRQERPRLSG